MNFDLSYPRALWAVAGICLVGVLGVGSLLYETASISLSVTQEPKVIVGGVTLRVTVADTAAERAKGLSGVPFLPETDGMVFLFPDEEYQTFWMKDMLIPIDIIWVRNGAIVGVEENVLPPELGTPETLLARFRSPVPVDMAVEVAAGFAKRRGLSVGTSVQMTKDSL